MNLDQPDEMFYVAALSNLTAVYKGLVMPENLPEFYPDLKDPRLKSAICLFHQRFSTNTLPNWRYAQPFRFLAHNGEINTIEGNRSWSEARTPKFQTPLLPDLQKIRPLVNQEGSDSSSLDNMLELFLAGGMDVFRAMRILIPPAWQAEPDMSTKLRSFYEFNSMHVEPWDGPAGYRHDQWPCRHLQPRSKRSAPGTLRDHEKQLDHACIRSRCVGLQGSRRG